MQVGATRRETRRLRREAIKESKKNREAKTEAAKSLQECDHGAGLRSAGRRDLRPQRGTKFHQRRVLLRPDAPLVQESHSFLSPGENKESNQQKRDAEVQEDASATPQSAQTASQFTQ